MARVQGRLQAWVVFVRSGATTDEWAKTDLWSSASAIPGVRTLIDDGSEARRFGAETSGETLLYGGSGRLLFAGGITGARGHYGDNAGVSAVSDLIDRPDPRLAGTSAVYGCPLFAASALRAKGVTHCNQ
nr:hypothetical protein Hi04_10k_c5981_00014 [uncultured bacterium]